MIRRLQKLFTSFHDKQIRLCFPKLNHSPQFKANFKTSLSETKNLHPIFLDQSFLSPGLSEMKKLHLREENFIKYSKSTLKSFANLSYYNGISEPISFFKVATKNFSVKIYSIEKNKNPLRVGGNYRNLIGLSSIFSDKSLLIKEIVQSNNEIILICMPRRWGKTTNLMMLNLFLSKEYNKQNQLISQKEGPNYKLFFDETCPLDISNVTFEINKKKGIEKIKSSEFCCTQPVIYLNFRSCNHKNYKMLQKLTRSKIIELYKEHRYLDIDKNFSQEYRDELKKLSGVLDDEVLTNSIYNLLGLLYRKHEQKVWILIDEYDAPINNLIMDSNNYNTVEKTFDLFKNIYLTLLKDSDYIEKAILTGILYLSQSGFFSGLNNVCRYSIDDYEIAQYYGLSEKELQEFLAYYRVDQKMYSQIKEWYNGYKLIKNDETRELEDRYNIWSVVNYLDKKKFKQYWMNTKLFYFIRPILATKEFKTIIEDLINFKSVECSNPITDFDIKEFEKLNQIVKKINVIELDSDGINLVLSYLYCLGYLTNSEEKNHYIIPNYEIRKTFISIMTKYYEEIYSFDNKKGQEITKIINSIVSQTSKDKIREKLIKFQIAFQEFLESIKVNILQNEDLFHCILVYLSLLAADIELGTEIHTKKNKNFKIQIVEDEVAEKQKDEEKVIEVQVAEVQVAEVQVAEESNDEQEEDGKGNKKGKKGYADIFIAKKITGIIIEIKYNQKKDTGLNQALCYSPLLEGREIKLFVSLRIDVDRKVRLKYAFRK